MSFRVLILFTFLFVRPLISSSQESPDFSSLAFEVNALSDSTFQKFMNERLHNSQFVMIGEQHGIREAGFFTDAVYNLGQNHGYNTLCIETDAVAAEKISEIAASSKAVENAKELNMNFPFAIPFYNNEEDYNLLKNVIAKEGSIWGIDQTFMVQFRLNFDYLLQQSKNPAFVSLIQREKTKAENAFKASVEGKDFSKNYIFSYDEDIHNSLLSSSSTVKEKEVLNQFWKTKEIYSYHTISQEYYKNNNVRGQLMKSNFLRYYKKDLKEGKTPKVVFKLGANHAARGLTRTNIYDISNLAMELAVYNDMKSIHILCSGITGEVLTGNPFAPNPVVPFDNTKQLPEEIKPLVADMTGKYFIMDLVPLREHAYGKRLSEPLKDLIFGYDLLVLVKNAEALTPFQTLN